jgi:hypothetical protein
MRTLKCKYKAGRRPLGRKPTNITLPLDVKRMGMRTAFKANITFSDYIESLIRGNCMAEKKGAANA